MEFVLLGTSLAIYTSKHQEPKAGGCGDGQIRNGVTTWEAVEFIFNILRILFLLALVFLYATFALLRWSKVQAKYHGQNGTSAETSRLLNGHGIEDGITNGQGYGSIASDPVKPDKATAEDPGWARKDKIPTKSWWEYLRGYRLFLPYLWPAKSPHLQASVMVCILLVVAQRVVNVLVPFQAGKITNILSGEREANPGLPWFQICLFIIYRLLQGSSGLLNAARACLWIPIGQYSYRELSTASFEHVHSLSLDFHLGKKTGEVISALSKGNSINNFLEQLSFQLGPMLVDLVVAFGYFLVAFDVYYALVVAVVMCVYVYATVRLAQWRVTVRRDMANLDRQMDAVK
jgi:hypothetical protein